MRRAADVGCTLQLAAAVGGASALFLLHWELQQVLAAALALIFTLTVDQVPPPHPASLIHVTRS